MFHEVVISHRGVELQGHYMRLEKEIKAWILFAHGSGSSRKSKRNNWVADKLNKAGYGTLLFDLLTPEEDEIYLNRFNIPLLAERLVAATDWLMNSDLYKNEKIGYFGASTGAAAALMAAATVGAHYPLFAIVSRGGRPDLAKREYLTKVIWPTLLLVGGNDEEVIKLNEWARDQLSYAQLVIIPGATHLFEEAGKLEEVVKMSLDWFSKCLLSQDRNHWGPEL
jgi:putative phosphoribosyl transferase